MSRSNDHTPDFSNYANEAKAAAECAVLGGLAFDLSKIKTLGIEPEWFDDPQHRAIYVALYAYKHSHSTATQCGPSALIQYIASTPELTGPFSDNNGASLDDIRGIIGNGHFDSNLLESNASVLREAAFEVWRRELWAKSERLPQHRFVHQMEESLAALKSQQFASGNGMPVSGLNVLNVEDITAKPVNWLWEDRIPRSMLSFVAGDPGQGKSLAFCSDLPARVSIGADFPDGAPGVGPGDVILFCAEDDPEYTVKPRLVRAGADVSRIKIVESAQVLNPKTGKLEYQPFDVSVHVPLLSKLLATLPNPLWVIIDPISEYMGKVDQHKGGEVRGAIHPLIQMASEFGVAVTGLGHLNKSAGGKAAYRASGSLAFVAASRSYYLVGTDPDDHQKRFLLPSKVNITRPMDALSYCIGSDGPHEAPFIHWGESVPMNGDQFLEHEAKAFAAKSREGDESELARAVEFVKKQLASGPMTTKELDAAVRANDIANATFRRAKGQLEIRCEKASGPKGAWWTLMPGQTIPKPPDKQGAQPPQGQIVEHVEHVEQLTLDAASGEGAQGAQHFMSVGDEQVTSEDDHLTKSGKRTRKASKPRKASA